MNPLKETGKTFSKYLGFFLIKNLLARGEEKNKHNLTDQKSDPIRKNLYTKNYVTKYNCKVYRGSLT